MRTLLARWLRRAADWIEVCTCPPENRIDRMGDNVHHHCPRHGFFTYTAKGKGWCFCRAPVRYRRTTMLGEWCRRCERLVAHVPHEAHA